MNSALLVIDTQESFRQRDSWADISAPDIAERVARLVEHARRRGDEVVWILHEEPGTGTVFDPLLGHVRLLDGLEPAAEHLVGQGWTREAAAREVGFTDARMVRRLRAGR